MRFVNDGDKALVVQDKTIVDVAERNMEGIVPLYYEMAKAEAEEINSEDIYKSLVSAYKANIGEISNNITKIWNSDNVNLDVIKWLCMENNFTIDFAKTLYMPTRPDHVNEIISKYIKARVPHFFIYAKDKEKDKVEGLNSSVVNKLDYIIPNKPIQFKKIAGELDYKILMSRSNVNLNSKLIKIYTKFDKNKKILMNKKDELDSNETSYFYQSLRNELLSVNDNSEYVTDVLIKYLYENKNSKHKTTLWNAFGDVIVNNIRRNLKSTKQCESCGKRIENYNTKKYCGICAKEKLKESKRIWKRKNGRKNQVV